jgi:ribose 5-phosphate isomerase B
MNEHIVPTIILAADHAGYAMKEQVKKLLKNSNTPLMIVDQGAEAHDATDDYPDIISRASEALQKSLQEGFRVAGIFFGGSGYGEAMVANRYSGIRAIVWYGPHSVIPELESEGTAGSDGYDIVRLARRHNNANVLSIGARFVTNSDELMRVIEIFLSTPFDDDSERHTRRIEKIDTLTV